MVVTSLFEFGIAGSLPSLIGRHIFIDHYRASAPAFTVTGNEQ
jgi:hypothetical protein